MTIDDASALTHEDLRGGRAEAGTLEGYERPAGSVVDIPSANLDPRNKDDQVRPAGPPSGDNPDYVSWLIGQSLLAAVKDSDSQSVGQGSMWQNPYGQSNPRGPCGW